MSKLYLEIKKEVEDLLAGLPDDPNTIANFMTDIECYGLPCRTNDCPIACYIKKSIPELDWYVSTVLIVGIMDGVNYNVFIKNVPFAIKQFIDAFDGYKYKELICTS